MKKPTLHRGPVGLQSGQKFCNLHPGCTPKSLICMEFSSKPDCRMQVRKNRLQSKKIVVNQQVGMSSTLYCKPPISYRDREVIPADAVLPLIDCVGVTRAREVV